MLLESEQMRREADDTGPYAEFEHWRQLNARFNSVLEQIRSHECRMAIQILHISKTKILKVAQYRLLLLVFKTAVPFVVLWKCIPRRRACISLCCLQELIGIARGVHPLPRARTKN